MGDRFHRLRPILTCSVAQEVASCSGRTRWIRLEHARHLFRSLDWLDCSGCLLFSYRDARQYAGQPAGGPAVRTGFDEQFGQPFVGRLVSRRGGIIQPCRLVSDGMHPGQQPVVRQLAQGLFLCFLTEPFDDRRLLSAFALIADRVEGKSARFDGPLPPSLSPCEGERENRRQRENCFSCAFGLCVVLAILA